MNEHIKDMGNILQNIHNLITQINNPGQVGIKELWKYCIQNKIDIKRTEINNINNIVESGYGKNGTIVQLFSIFKYNKHFYISEERQEICQICNNIKCFKPTLHSHLIIIYENWLNLKNIEMNLQYTLVYDELMVCERCNLGKNFPSSRITYQILNYPQFLFILFDLRSYNQLLQNKEALKKIFREQLKFTDKDNYILKGCVTSPSYNHFTFYINKLKIKR